MNINEKKMSSVGEVTVHKGIPPNGNPYRGVSAIGNERMCALMEFYDKGECEGYTFWHAPCGGGARLVTSDQVNWNTCGVEDLRAKVSRIYSLGMDPLKRKEKKDE